MSTIELNLRLDVRGRASTAAEIAQRQAQALALLGTWGHRRHDAQFNGALAPSLVACVEGWTEAEVYDLAVRMGQDCIAVLDVVTGKGSLIGPSVEGYGDFDLSHFHRLNEAQREQTLDEVNKDMAEALGFAWGPCLPRS